MLKLLSYLIALPFAFAALTVILTVCAFVLGTTLWAISKIFEASAILGILSIVALFKLFAVLETRLGVKSAEEKEREAYIAEVLRDEINPYRACADGIKEHPRYKTCDTCRYEFFCNRVDLSKRHAGQKPPKPEWACEWGINYIPWRHCDWCEYYFVCEATKNGAPHYFDKGFHIPPPGTHSRRHSGSARSTNLIAEPSRHFNNNFRGNDYDTDSDSDGGYDYDNDSGYDYDTDSDDGYDNNYFNSWSGNSTNNCGGSGNSGDSGDSGDGGGDGGD